MRGKKERKTREREREIRERADTHHRQERIRRSSFSFCIQDLIAATASYWWILFVSLSHPHSLIIQKISILSSLSLFFIYSLFMNLFANRLFPFSNENSGQQQNRKWKTRAIASLPTVRFASPFALSSTSPNQLTGRPVVTLLFSRRKDFVSFSIHWLSLLFSLSLSIFSTLFSWHSTISTTAVVTRCRKEQVMPLIGLFVIQVFLSFPIHQHVTRKFSMRILSGPSTSYLIIAIANASQIKLSHVLSLWRWTS